MERIYPVYEYHTRITPSPSIGRHHDHQIPGVHLTADVPSSRIDKLYRFVELAAMHELIGYRHRDVEVLQASVLLACYELRYVWMVHNQDSHVGAPSSAPLLYDLGRSIEYSHERDRAACNPAGAPHNISLRTKAREAEACASAALVYKSHVLKSIEYPDDGILHRNDKASGELAEGKSSVHERRGVGEEVERGHHG